MPIIMSRDYETRSESDLKAFGAYKYARDPSTEVLMVSYTVQESHDDEPEIYQWNITESPKPPKEYVELLLDPSVQKWAYNNTFELQIERHVLDIQTPLSSCYCTMALAFSMGLAGGLEQVGQILRIPEDKQKLAIGKSLINLFSKPQRITKKQPNKWILPEMEPEKWEQYLTYNWGDTAAEWEIKRRLMRYNPCSEFEWEIYRLDQIINDRGVFVDKRLAENATKMAAEYRAKKVREMQKLTGLDNPNSVTQLKPWLQARGYPFDDVNKDTVKKVINSGEYQLSPDVLKAFALRSDVSRNSIKKYETMVEAACDDGRVKGMLQYGGASRTKRWAGRIVQLQNLSRTPKYLEGVDRLQLANGFIRRCDLEGLELFCGNPMDAIVGCVRSALCAQPGNIFTVADLASIESVAIGYLTNCQWILNVLHNKHDIYKSFASAWLRKPYEEVDKNDRTQAKPACLGSGYRLGGGEIIDGKKTGLWAYAEGMGIIMSKEDAHSSTNTFRELCPEIVNAWYDLERAAEKTVRDKRTRKVLCFTFRKEGGFLTIELPSGRKLYYCRPELTEKTLNGRNGPYVKTQLTYEGRTDNGKWARISTHGGKLIENLVQAFSRDILAVGLVRAHKKGMKTVFHVHDEIVTENKIGKYTVDELIRCMTDPIDWAPGIPLGAAGWQGHFYMKD